MASTEAGDRRTQIVRTAALLFEEKGYHATGMDDIAEAVGLRKPTLYHYVRSKAEILTWIHNDTMVEVLNNLEKNVEDDIEPREGLRQVIADILEIMDTKPGYLRAFFEHHREIPEPLRTEAIRSRDRYQWLVESLIQRGIRRGIFRPVRVRLATLMLFGITNWSYQWYRPGGELTYREVADELLTMYLTGIETPELHPDR
jgi:TetR/AcrR family transcriptional regulator, cholesterol catabolism regulator